ncbi:MAG: hypothetical protein M0P76_03615, partial [Candidatus Pacebacteria bacterium]|nr:hypothetical protein [Candidatus Paceibacterota bacterium]
ISADEMRTLMVISFAAVGFIFFMLAPRVYEGYTERVKMFQFLWLGVIDLVILLFVFSSPLLSEFFNVVPVPIDALNSIFIFIAISSVTHYAFVSAFFPKRKNTD